MWKWLKTKRIGVFYSSIFLTMVVAALFYQMQAGDALQYGSAVPGSSQPIAPPSPLAGDPSLQPESAGAPISPDAYRTGAERPAKPGLPLPARRPDAMASDMSWDSYNLLVERGLQQLKRFEIYHNNPDTLPLDKATKIVLSVASKDKVSAKAAAEAAYGPTLAAQVDLGMTVRAELVGADSDVAIQPVGQPIRSISAGSNTTWEWFVLPKTTDDFEMSLRLFNQHQVGDRMVETEGPAYTNVFHVHATLGQKVKLWLSLVNGWLALLGGSILALGGWILTKLKARFWPGKPSAKAGQKKAK